VAKVNRIRQKTTVTLSEDAKNVLIALCDKRGQTQSTAIERMIFKEGKEEGITPQSLKDNPS
jgi:hypothetical protein